MLRKLFCKIFLFFIYIYIYLILYNISYNFAKNYMNIYFRALEALVNFAYTGKVVLDKNNVQSIMIGASYLQLTKVRDACANYLLQRYNI